MGSAVGLDVGCGVGSAEGLDVGCGVGSGVSSLEPRCFLSDLDFGGTRGKRTACGHLSPLGRRCMLKEEVLAP